MPKFIFLAACAIVFLASASAVRAEVLQGVPPLQEGELAQLCGGFTLPNGMDLNVGIDNQVSLNGQAIADAHFSLNGTTVTTSASGTMHVQSVNGNTNILQLSAVGPTVISNTASNIALNQVRTITIDMTNLTKMNLQSMSSFAMLQSQAINGLKNGLH